MCDPSKKDQARLREQNHLMKTSNGTVGKSTKNFCQKMKPVFSDATDKFGNRTEHYKMTFSRLFKSGRIFLTQVIKNLKDSNRNRATSVDKSLPKFRRKVMTSNLYPAIFIFACCSASMMTVSGYESGRNPPRVVASGTTKSIAYLGQTLTLPCMVSGTPFPMTVWWKDGVKIGRDWQRYKQQENGLRIRKVEASDSGLYHCEAVNGHGTESAMIKLQVQERTKRAKSPKRKRETAKPIFSQPVKMRRHSIVKPLGGTVSFKCKAKGKPKPKIQWYKEGNLTGIPNPSESSKPRWILTLRDIKSRDSGRYTCRVWNSVGEISFEYILRVVGISRHERPVLLKPHPLNTTVNSGGKASVQCRVRSVISPTVKWIKRLDHDSLDAFNGNLPNNSLEIKKKFYLILPPQEMMRLQDGSYLNKLVIAHATAEDSGMYICLAANTMGYNFRYAYLTVKPAGESRLPLSNLENEESLPLATVIAVPASIGIVLVIVITIYCLSKRGQFENFSGSSSMQTRVPQDPHDVDACYEEVPSLPSASSRLDDFVTTPADPHRVNVYFAPDVEIGNHSSSVAPKYTVNDRIKDSSYDQTFSDQLESDTTSNYIHSPPPPPPPSQHSLSSSTDAGNWHMSHHRCQLNSRGSHKHRKRAPTNSSSFQTYCPAVRDSSDS